jgi:hypothetical protein
MTASMGYLNPVLKHGASIGQGTELVPEREQGASKLTLGLRLARESVAVWECGGGRQAATAGCLGRVDVGLWAGGG